MYLVIQTQFPEGLKRILGLYSSQANAKRAIEGIKAYYVEKEYANAGYDSFDWICLTPDEDQAEWIRFG
jgi:hypothetical protein